MVFVTRPTVAAHRCVPKGQNSPKVVRSHHKTGAHAPEMFATRPRTRRLSEICRNQLRPSTFNALSRVHPTTIRHGRIHSTPTTLTPEMALRQQLSYIGWTAYRRFRYHHLAATEAAPTTATCGHFHVAAHSHGSEFHGSLQIQGHGDRTRQINSGTTAFASSQKSTRRRAADNHDNRALIRHVIVPLSTWIKSRGAKFTNTDDRIHHLLSDSGGTAQSRSSGRLTLVSSRRGGITMRWVSAASTRARIRRSPAATRASARSASALR